MSKKPNKRSYSEWRIDIDYWAKLNAADQAYLVNFLDGYYHEDREIASQDIVTLTVEQASDILTPRQRSHYTPDDYMEERCPRSASTRKTLPSE